MRYCSHVLRTAWAHSSVTPPALGLRYTKYFAQSAELFPATLVEDQDVTRHEGRLLMSKVLVPGAAAVALSLALSAASASAQVYVTPSYGYGYATPVADLAAPNYGYAAPAYGYAAPAYVAPAPVYAAPPAYAAPAYTAAPPVAPLYTTPPVVSGYYAAPSAVVSQPMYDYSPGHWGGYGYGWR